MLRYPHWFSYERCMQNVRHMGVHIIKYGLPLCSLALNCLSLQVSFVLKISPSVKKYKNGFIKEMVGYKVELLKRCKTICKYQLFNIDPTLA